MVTTVVKHDNVTSAPSWLCDINEINNDLHWFCEPTKDITVHDVTQMQLIWAVI